MSSAAGYLNRIIISRSVYVIAIYRRRETRKVFWARFSNCTGAQIIICDICAVMRDVYHFRVNTAASGSRASTRAQITRAMFAKLIAYYYCVSDDTSCVINITAFFFTRCKRIIIKIYFSIYLREVFFKFYWKTSIVFFKLFLKIGSKLIFNLKYVPVIILTMSMYVYCCIERH